MKTIWKQPLTPQSLQKVMLPEGAEILSAAEQYGAICIWFRGDPTAPKTERLIAICGTGHGAPNGRFIDTVLMVGGSIVMHVFEVQPE